MGAPELPNDPGDEDLRTTRIVHHPPAPSDESDNETLQDEDVYEGYQPLAMDDHHNDVDHMQLEANNDDYIYNAEAFNRIQANRDFRDNEPFEVMHSGPNMTQIDTADVEIEREVWNQPRPRELQIELDGDKTQQILSAMANFQLPNLAVPDWAAGIPEERWKEELLQRIRQRKLSNENTKMEVGKE